MNIFTPLVLEPTTPLPVMIFIHGGEFEQFGASAPIYNSQRWVNMTNIIIVLIQYRLGKFTTKSSYTFKLYTQI